MKILPMTLKKKWFDMILSGEKKEEYREINDYWAIHFVNGYGSTRPCFDIEIDNFTIKRGTSEWGAEGGKFYFVFQLGNILDDVEV